MKSFPLQDDLIDGVVAFANVQLETSEQAGGYFKCHWKRGSLPDVKQCRRIQTEVRKWLSGLDSELPAVNAMIGGPNKKAEHGVRLIGALGYEARPGHRQITWDWWITDTSLRAICGLAVVSIFNAGLTDKVGRCARDGCENYFIDRKSRGIIRRYCKTDACEKAVNRDRVRKKRSEDKK